jgi:hypothetical protein
VRAVLGAAVLTLAGSLVCAVAHAQPAVTVSVTADGCPDPALLQQKLDPLLGAQTRVAVTSGPLERSAEQHAAVHDLGERYTIELDGLQREFTDPTRDCVERARVAAVFIALNLKTPRARPTLAAAAPAPPEPPPEPPPAPDAERVQLGALLAGQAAYATAIGAGTAGAGAGLWLGRGALRLDFLAGILAPTRIALTPRNGVHGSVDLLRLPLTLSASYLLRTAAVAVGPTLGLDLDVLRLRGVDLFHPETALRVNPGLLVGVDARAQLSAGLALALRLQLDGFPRAYALSVDKLGRLGQTPRLWLGASLGLQWRLR